MIVLSRIIEINVVIIFIIAESEWTRCYLEDIPSKFIYTKIGL